MDIADIFYGNFETMENRTEYPMLFSTPMVQAILEERKTMTRRTKGLEELSTTGYEYKGILKSFRSKHVFARIWKGSWVETIHIKCPYGEPGDLLYVRETWMHAPNYPDLPEKYYYKASMSDQFIKEWPKSWKPSIHMPKKAARIWLEITSVRVERLQDISNEDALKEGIKVIEPNEAYFDYMQYAGSYLHPRGSFFSLWDKINGKESLEQNQWVWVVEFKVLKTYSNPH